MKNLILIAISIVLVGVGCLIGCYFNYNNQEIKLRTEAETQRSKVEGVHDKMWKVIQQKAQVTDEYKDAFSEIYPAIMEGRYSVSNDGSLMKWVTEQNPNFDTSLYKDLMQSIEILRTEFQNNQERMLDIVREHQVYISIFPNRLFISNKTPIEYTVISSTITKDVMKTGTDDNVDIFS